MKEQLYYNGLSICLRFNAQYLGRDEASRFFTDRGYISYMPQGGKKSCNEVYAQRLGIKTEG